MGSCASTKTAQLNNQDDDVYYTVAKAKEYTPQEVVQNEDKRSRDYVTEENLYGDAREERDYYGYYDDYASRFNRFGTFAPSLGYFNSIYGYYDPFYSNLYFPNSYLGISSFNMGWGLGYGNWAYNPWRSFGYNYGFGYNFWGPYSYYNPYSTYALGFRNGYYGGAYAGIYSSPSFIAPNYRSRPGRTSDNLSSDRINSVGRPGTIGNNGSGSVNTAPRSRAERYGVQTQTRPSTTQSSGNSGNRTQEARRPERVNQNPPQRVSQPERIYSAPPRQDSGSGSRSNPAPSNSGGGSSARPSRGN